MLHHTIKKSKVILIWIIIYIAILAFSVLITGLYLASQNKDLHHIAETDMMHFKEHSTFAPLVLKHDINNFFYDEDLNCIAYYEAHDSQDAFDFLSFAQKAYPIIMEQGEYTKLIIHPKLEYWVGIAIALPYEDDGIFVFMKEFDSIKSIYRVLVPSLSLSILFCAILTLFLVKKNNDFERMQREYVDNISHELKSPLASVRALTTAIHDGLVKDENKQKHYCSIMLNEINHLERTVSDMLELSRIQNHQVDCEKQIYTAYDLFGDVIAKRQALCEDLNIDLRMSPSLDEYPFMQTNKLLASRLLDILLDNAIKFTPVDGHVHIIMSYNQKQVTISVRDSGPGIPAEDKPHIFERFYKADKAHNEKGSGLGLAIAKEIADSLGEKLWLASTRPEGAEFSFTIQKI